MPSPFSSSSCSSSWLSWPFVSLKVFELTWPEVTLSLRLSRTDNLSSLLRLDSLNTILWAASFSDIKNGLSRSFLVGGSSDTLLRLSITVCWKDDGWDVEVRGSGSLKEGRGLLVKLFVAVIFNGFERSCRWEFSILLGWLKAVNRGKDRTPLVASYRCARNPRVMEHSGIVSTAQAIPNGFGETNGSSYNDRL